MNKHIITKLSSLLVGIDQKKPPMFSGIGIIVYNDFSALPVAPLKDPSVSSKLIFDSSEIESYLLQISGFENDFHDGFHLMDENFSLTHLSQYFAAPIVDANNVEYHFGSRYRAAFYGSFLSSVLACGVIGNAHQSSIFQGGQKIDPYEWLSQ